MIRACILPKSRIPLLLSKEFLRQLKCKIDLDSDRIFVFGRWLGLRETEKGHYGVPCFDFDGDCCVADVEQQTKVKASIECHGDRCNADQPLYQLDHRRSVSNCPSIGSEKAEHHVVKADRDSGIDEQHQGEHHRLGEHQASGHDARSRSRQSGSPSDWRLDSKRGEISQGPRASQPQRDLHQRQGLCGVDSESHRHTQQPGDAEAQVVHPDSRREKEGTVEGRDEQRQQGRGSSQGEECGRNRPSHEGTGGGSEHGLAVSGSERTRPEDHRDHGRHANQRSEYHEPTEMQKMRQS